MASNPTLIHLIPLIQQLPKLSWNNFTDTHDRWSEEVVSLCTLAGRGVHASLRSSPSLHGKESVKNDDKYRKDVKGKERNQQYTIYDDQIARSIIILCTSRDIRERFGKFIKAASTAKQLFNGIAILKEAVAEGQAREREAGGFVPESELQYIRNRVLAMAEEMDWSSIASESGEGGRGSKDRKGLVGSVKMTLLWFTRWRKHDHDGSDEE